MFNRKEPTAEEKYNRAILRYFDLRALMKGLKPSLHEEHKEAIDEVLQETDINTDAGADLEKQFRN